MDQQQASSSSSSSSSCAADEEQPLLLQKRSIAGGPVTCVTFWNGDIVLVAKGPYLECSCSLLHPAGASVSSYRAFHNGGTIHGIETCTVDDDGTNRRSLAVVFGGRQLALFYIQPKQQQQQQQASFETISINVNGGTTTALRDDVLTVSDWIWSIKLIQKQSSSTKTKTIIMDLVISMAHNTCDVWRLIRNETRCCCCCWTAVRMKRIVCTTRCITYSSSLYYTDHPDCLNVAYGTVYNEILVWNVKRNDKEEEEDFGSNREKVTTTAVHRDVQHVLKGHEGAVHSVRVCGRGEYIASTSDDRTVRLWKKLVDNQHKYVLHWTGWNGHSARVWDSAFWNNSQAIISVGEDGVAIVWDSKMGGKQLAVWRGHKSIWTVASHHHGMVVTGGNNGTAQVWDLQRRLLTSNGGDTCWDVLVVPNDYYKPTSVAAKREAKDHSNLEGKGKVATEMSVGDDGAVDSQGASKKMKNKKKAKKRTGQVVFGMEFYDNNGRKLLVATRSGSLFSYCLLKNEWTELEPWWVESNSHSVSYKAVDGSSMAVHSGGVRVAIGTTRGKVVLVTLQQERSNTDKNAVPTTVLSSEHGKSVQGLKWAHDDTLVVFYIKGIVILWKHIAPTTASTADYDMGMHRVLSIDTVGIPMCFAQHGDCVFVGDSRGNIASFKLDKDCDSDSQIIHPTDVATRVHKKEHVTDMVIHKQLLVSVGNDGCLHECMINVSSGVLHKALSIPAASFSGICRVWQRANGSLVVGGYYGNQFAVVNVTTGMELFRVDTGGRQRQQDCFVELDDDGTGFRVYGVAICASRKDGTNDIILQRCLPNNDKAGTCLLEHTVGVGLHGETIFDAALCFTPSGLLVLSGSEDCTTRLSCIKNGVVVHSKVLQPHESCVRAVGCSRAPRSTLLVTCGGKLTMQFFVLQHGVGDVHGVEHMPVWFLGDGCFPWKATIDHRINAVKAISLRSSPDETTETHLVVTGDSNGAIVLFLVAVGKNVVRQSPVRGHVLHTAARPILSLEILPVGPFLLVLAGTTGGDVLVWNLPSHKRAFASLLLEDGMESTEKPIAVYKAHTMGTNTISATVTNETDRDGSSKSILICSGGDDQAMTVCKAALVHSSVHVESSPEKISIEIVSVHVTKEASASAIKGVHFVANDTLLSVGYSQRLALWKMEEESCCAAASSALKLVASSPVDVSDVNCLSYCSLPQQQQQQHQACNKEASCIGVAVVGGEGLEVFNVLEDETIRDQNV